MTNSYPDALPLSRKVLRGLIALNLLMGVGILVLLVASFVREEWVMRALAAHHADGNETFVAGMRTIMIIGILSIPLTHLVLTRLLAIVETVRDGNPFVRENAERLQWIAWWVVGLEMLHFAVGAVAARVSSTAHPLDLDWSFSFTRWIAILLLFVLARVFDQGTRMREDLEGTV